MLVSRRYHKSKKRVRIIYLSNLPYMVEERTLRRIFGKYELIENISIIRNNPKESRPYTYAFITFDRPIYVQNRREFINGKPIYIAPADRSNHRFAPRNVHQRYPANNPPVEDNLYREDILNVLNFDCLVHIMSYLPLKDLIRSSERINERWDEVALVLLKRVTTLDLHNVNDMNFPITHSKLAYLLRSCGANLQVLSIYCNMDLCHKSLELISQYCKNLEYLEIIGFEFVELGRRYQWCSKLKTVKVDRCVIADQHLYDIPPGIEEIAINGCRTLTGDFLTRVFPSKKLLLTQCEDFQSKYLMKRISEPLPNMISLHLDLPKLQTSVDMLENMPNLESMHCNYKSLDFVHYFPPSENLTEVHIVNSCLFTNRHVLELCRNCPNLETVDISTVPYYRILNQNGNVVTNDGVREILKLKKLKKLTIVAVMVSAGVFRNLNKAFPSQLEHINCGMTWIEDRDITELIKFCPKLEVITASMCPLLTPALVPNIKRILAKEPTRRGISLFIYLGNDRIIRMRRELTAMSNKRLTVSI